MSAQIHTALETIDDISTSDYIDPVNACSSDQNHVHVCGSSV